MITHINIRLRWRIRHVKVNPMWHVKIYPTKNLKIYGIPLWLVPRVIRVHRKARSCVRHSF